MSMLNITRLNSSSDPTFRYKMPALVTQIEGKGNGIKTVLLNIDKVASALGRPENIIIKYFSIEIGAQCCIEKRFINGSHDQSHLQKLIHQFIDLYVLCPICNLPETDLSLSHTKNSVKHKCSACGAKTAINSDNKFCKYLFSLVK